MPILRRLALVAALAGTFAVGASPVVAAPSPRYAPDASVAAEARPLDTFELDNLSREIPERGKFTCPEIDVVSYRGKVIKLQKPVRLHQAFIERVQRFEQVVREVAIRVYGRAPRAMRHLGGYVCRRMKTYPNLLSEHAVGDAIDVEGFDFGSATKAERAAAPKGLRGSFQISIERHWTATRGTGAVHARFLRELADALIARDDIFRVMLGHSYPDHQNHFHLDMSVFRMIEL